MEKNPTIWRKIENKVIQSDEFIVKESQCYNVSALINHHQDFKNWLINNGCYIYKARTYDRLIIKSAFIFQKVSCDRVKQWCKKNGTIKTYNRLEREKEKEKKNKKKKKEEKAKEKRKKDIKSEKREKREEMKEKER